MLLKYFFYSQEIGDIFFNMILWNHKKVLRFYNIIFIKKIQKRFRVWEAVISVKKKKISPTRRESVFLFYASFSISM